MGKALVDRIRLAAVGLGDPPGQAVGVAADDLQAAVGGAAIHDDIFQARVVLAEHGADGGFQEARLIERRRDDGDQRQVVHGVPLG